MISGCRKSLLTKPVTEFFHGFSCQTIDNPTLSPPFLQQFQQFPFLVARSSDSKIQVFSVETCCNLKRVLQLQQATDVLADLLGCSSRKGTDNRTLWQLVQKFCNAEITLPEVLPPLRNAVCFIHRNHRNFCLLCKR